MIAQIIRSLLLLIIISSSVGGIGYFFDTSLLTFVKYFVLATGLQIIFFFLYNNVLRYIARLNLEKESLQLAQLAEKNKVFVECQGCKNTNSVDIDLTQENSFKCINCGAENKINIEFTTILPTNPIYDK
tara:strand:- start:60 stop:449 length:390 start_codon:yes stop_codon:yes gene_type:complete